MGRAERKYLTQLARVTHDRNRRRSILPVAITVMRLQDGRQLLQLDLQVTRLQLRFSVEKNAAVLHSIYLLACTVRHIHGLVDGTPNSI